MTSRAFLVGLLSLLVGALAPSAAAAQVAVPPLPARLYGTIQLEAPRTGYLHVEIQPGPTTVQVETCLTSGPGDERCRGPLRRQTLGATELAELTRLWNALHTPAACSVIYPSTAPTHRFWPVGGSSEGQRLPEATHESMGYDPCVAGGRLAWWTLRIHDRP